MAKIKAMPLPFARNVHAPHISVETYEYHYDRHFMAYVKCTNEFEQDLRGSLEDAIRNAPQRNTVLFQAAGQVWNHAFFWMSLRRERGLPPSEPLANAISRDFGSELNLADAFVKAGTHHFGSGWCWLISDRAGSLSITTTHDAMPVWVERDAVPILVCDLWEHAYYIDWRNDRSSFLRAFIHELPNWQFAAQQYAAAKGEVGLWRYV